MKKCILFSGLHPISIWSQIERKRMLYMVSFMFVFYMPDEDGRQSMKTLCMSCLCYTEFVDRSPMYTCIQWKKSQNCENLPLIKCSQSSWWLSTVTKKKQKNTHNRKIANILHSQGPNIHTLFKADMLPDFFSVLRLLEVPSHRTCQPRQENARLQTSLFCRLICRTSSSSWPIKKILDFVPVNEPTYPRCR